MSQKLCKLLIGHGSDFAVFVTGHTAVGVLRAGALHLHGSGQTHIGSVGSHQNLIVSRLHFPAVGLHIEVAESLVIKFHSDSLALPCCQEHLGKALEFLLGAEYFAVCAGDINLGNLSAVPVTGIGDREGDTGLVGMNIGIFKSRVAQAIAEGIAHRHSGGVIIAIADVKPLPVFGGALLAGEVVVRGVVLQLQRPGFIQLAGRIDLAQQGIGHGGAARLSAQVAVDNGTAAGWHHKRRAAGHHQHNILIDSGNRLDQLLLALAQLHVKAIHALRFGNFIQTDAQQHQGGILRHRNSLINHGLHRVGILTVITLGKPGDGHAAGNQAGIQVIQGSGVNHGGAGTLIAGVLTEVTDNRHLFLTAQRQNAVIFQQNNGLSRALPGKGVVGFLVKGLGSLLHCLIGGVHHCQ